MSIRLLRTRALVRGVAARGAAALLALTGLGIAAPGIAQASANSCTATIGPPIISSPPQSNTFRIHYTASVSCTFQVDAINIAVALWRTSPSGNMQLASSSGSAANTMQESVASTYEQACELGQTITVFESAQVQISTSQPFSYKEIDGGNVPGVCDVSPGPIV